jgi:DNA-binding beta-propeller fold protein YncE
MHPPGSVRAPEIALPGLTWFNTPEPLSLMRLRGRLVLLDFWTSCCVNCLQSLPALKRVAEGFPDTAVVIGVHSPKFTAEQDPRAIAAAVARAGIAYPVVHDPELRIWSSYAVKAWPTLIIVSPDSYVIGEHQGEPDADELFEAVGETITSYARHNRMWPRDLVLTPAPEAETTFRFPAKIKRLPSGGWALADSGHHQIVLLDDDGREIARVGAGVAGFDDGDMAAATFNAPQGIAADEAAIYVADTGNHAIRRIDGETGAVTTLAGDGRRGQALAAGPARGASLASPWDVACNGAQLYFANAGTHQLGVIDLATGALAPLVGNGIEGLHDGSALEAHLAQPSGLALSGDGRDLYFVDAESSAIRRLDLAQSTVETLAGAGLFAFGHTNGPAAEARFQHPLGIAWQDHRDGARLLIADTFNSRPRVLDRAQRVVADLDTGFACTNPVYLPPSEPAGIAVTDDGRILLADTNNHRVLVYDAGERSYRTWSG